MISTMINRDVQTLKCVGAHPQQQMNIASSKTFESREEEDDNRLVQLSVRDAPLLRVSTTEQRHALEDKPNDVEKIRRRLRSRTEATQRKIQQLKAQKRVCQDPKVTHFNTMLKSHKLRDVLGPEQVDCTEKRQHVGDYKLLCRIGRGGFGVIYAAKPRPPSEGAPEKKKKKIAIKKLQKSSYTRVGLLDSLEIELRVMKNRQHPNLLYAHDVIHGSDHVYIVMDQASKDLLDYYAKNWDSIELAEDQTLRTVMKGIVRGLHHLHVNGVAHMDIKPENVLVMRKCEPTELKVEDIKLCDFGLAIESKTVGGKVEYNAPHGTPGYFAPEVHTSTGEEDFYNCFAADMWSCGATMMALTPAVKSDSWFKLFSDRSASNQAEFWFDLAMALDRLNAWSMESSTNGRVGEIMMALLDLEPEKRPSTAALLEHYWFSD